MNKYVFFFIDKASFCFYNTFMNKRMIFAQGSLMTIDDLARYLKVTRRTIYEWLKQNKIPAVKLVGQWRFRKDRIDAWLNRNSLN